MANYKSREERELERKRKIVSEMFSASEFDELTERNVLGILVTNPDSCQLHINNLCEDKFFEEHNKKIFQAMRKILDQGSIPDFVKVTSYLKGNYDDETYRGLYDVLVECVTKSTSVGIDTHLSTLDELWRKRVLFELGLKLTHGHLATADNLEKIVNECQDVLASRKRNDIVDLRQMTSNIWKTAVENQANPVSKNKTYTGFDLIDNQGGFMPQMEIVLSAFSSQGKTAFATTIAMNAVRQGQSVAIYSMEMGEADITSRLLNIQGLGIQQGALKTEKLMDYEMKRLSDTINTINALPGNIYLDSSSRSNVDTVIASIRTLKQRYNIVGAIVDYIQIFTVFNKGGNNELMLAEIARKLQEEAKRSNVWIVVLSQLNKVAAGESHDPNNDRIRGSGQILEACDMSLMLYRPEIFKESYPEPYDKVDPRNTAMLKITKYRGGRLGEKIIGFEGDFTRFVELESVPLLTYSSNYENDPY